jgi:hypothetical protein
MKALVAIAGAGLISLLTGCVSAPRASVALAPVGPNPEGPRSGSSQGSLEVYSRFSVRTDDQNQASTDPVWYQHTDYYLCDPQGRVLKHVFNIVGHYAQDPRVVDLPAGHFVVEAQSAPNYWVKVPVVIKSGAITRIHLDGNWAPPSYVDKTQVVTLPNGKPVGWRM